jgi:hypothetical protein
MTAADQTDQNVKMSLANWGRPHMTTEMIRLECTASWGELEMTEIALCVMAGLDPAIQAATLCPEGRCRSAPVDPPTDTVWMAGSSPAMTAVRLECIAR